MNEWLVVGIGTTVALLFIGHWANSPRPLPLLGRYVYGVTAIVAGFAIWRLQARDWETVVGLAIIAVAGGLSVFIAYGWDGVVIAINKSRRAEAIDDELTR